MLNKYCVVIVMFGCLFLAKNTQGNDKFCRFINPQLGTFLHPRHTWNHLTGFWCNFYNDKERLSIVYNHTTIVYNNTRYFVSLINNGTDFFWYDYLNETSLHYLKTSFKKEIFFKKWLTCAREAVDCCDNFMTEANIIPTKDYPCPAVWDSWSCFPPTKPDTTCERLCPELTFSSNVRACELKSEKECFSNGTWVSKTNYNLCSIAPYLRNRHSFNVIVLAIASAVALPSIVIFFSFRNLRQKLLFILHRNLILVIIIRNVLSIMSKEIIIMNELRSSDTATVMSDNGVPCRILAFFENVAKNGIFACMLADGFYLHQTIAMPFAKEPSLIFIYSSVIVLSFLPSLIWAILRGVHNGLDCWMVDGSADQWVCDGFRFAILGINTVLLIDIIRVMILKLRRNGISQQARTTLRVTLFLIPLFGLHIIIISNRNMVPSNTCVAQNIYYYISYLVEGFQGIMVPILFCYINSDVHRELLNAVRKLQLYLEDKFDISFKRKNVYRRRATTATYVGSESES